MLTDIVWSETSETRFHPAISNSRVLNLAYFHFNKYCQIKEKNVVPPIFTYEKIIFLKLIKTTYCCFVKFNLEKS
ncbi:hypothetical protein C0J52_15319 [Blattella germanica]|nr:hypothetical protein C0J52_15319 [Blattella germanica]